ncbi:FmdB family zinc ribbon protein [Chloroflexota bacterium]
MSLTCRFGRLKLDIGEAEMPIYEYICRDCDSKFEKLRPVSQSSEKASCPVCQKEAERVLSSFCCLSTDETGIPSTIGGGSSCSSCASASCASCAT